MGDILRKTKFDEMKNSTNSACSRWGKTHATATANVNTNVTTEQINNLIAKLNECKSASGWTGTVIPAVSKGNKIIDISGSIISQANAIRLHCPCHGNCTGSCRTSCTGGCKGTCSGSCENYCRGCTGK